jgi:replication factor A1
MSELDSQVRKVATLLDNAGFDVTKDTIRDRFQAFQAKGVSPGEVEKVVTKNLLRDKGVDDPESVINRQETAAAVASASDVTPITDILEDGQGGQWYSINAKFLQEFSSDSSKISQKGILADETGEIGFTVWASSSLPERPLSPGESYHLDGVVTNWWEEGETLEIHLQSETEIHRLQTEIAVNTHEGVLISLLSSSGLIERCPDDTCSRVLKDGRCKAHGPVDGQFDLRIKGVLDTGAATTTIYLNQEQTTQLTGISMREAKQMAQKQIDKTVVREAIRKEVIGKYFHVEGRRISTGLAVDSVQALVRPGVEQYESTMERLETVSV